MSQKIEKTRRKVEKLEERVDSIEFQISHGIAVHKREALNAVAERNAERRRARRAERSAALWRRLTLAALVVAIIIEIMAIVALNARAMSIDSEKETVFVTSDLQAVGHIEPPDEDFENEKLEAALLEKANVIEGVTVTHYDCCLLCCGKTDGITASGAKATPGVTVAVDPSLIPLGSDVLVDYGDGEIHYYKADDTGGGVKGSHIDLCVSSHEEALQLGRRTATVYWVAPEKDTP